MEEPSDVSLAKLTKSGPYGPPAASDGPSSTHKAYTRGDHSTSDLQEFFNKILAGTTPTPTGHQGLGTARRAAWPTHKMWSPQFRRDQQDTALLRGPRRPCTRRHHKWTSRTNVGQQAPEWQQTNSNGSVTPMEPADDRCDETF